MLPQQLQRSHVAEDLEVFPFENTMQFKSDAFTYSTNTTMIANMCVYRSHIIPKYTRKMSFNNRNSFIPLLKLMFRHATSRHSSTAVSNTRKNQK